MQVYGFCTRTLHLRVISVMIIGVMRLSYNERAVPDGRFRHHLFQAVFMQTTYPSRYVYFRRSRVHTDVGLGGLCSIFTQFQYAQNCTNYAYNYAQNLPIMLKLCPLFLSLEGANLYVRIIILHCTENVN